MGPQLTLLMGAVVGSLLPARCCILCDFKVELALDSLEKEYLPTHIGRGRQQEVMEWIRQAVENFKDLPDLEPTYDKIVDDATMRMASRRFRRSLRMIINRGLTGDTFLKEFSKMLTREKEGFQLNVARFLKPGFCPNKCGRLLQLLRYCDNCTMHTKSCPKSTDCGVRQINVRELDNMILDCELDWHTIAEGVTNYSFYRVWGSNSETLMYKGKQPAVIKRMVMPVDAGNYRCELGTERSGPVSITRFEVTVLPQRITAQTMSKSSTMAQTISKSSSMAQTISKSSSMAQTMAKSSTIAQTISKSSTMAQTIFKSSTMAQTMSEASTMAQTMSKSSTIATIAETVYKPSTVVTQSSTIGTKASSIETQSATIRMPSPANVTKAEEKILDGLSLTLKPSESPKSEHVLRGRVVGLLIWGCVVLIIGLLTIALCYRPEKVMDSMNSRFPTYKRGIP